MSLYSEVWACPQVETPHERIVLLALAHHCNHRESRVAYPSVRRLAAMCHMSKQGVQNTTARLERKGVLRIIHGRGRRHPNQYVLAADLRQVSCDTQCPTQNGTIPLVTQCPTYGPKNVLPGRKELFKRNSYSPPELSHTEKMETLRKVAVRPESSIYSLLLGP